MLLTMQKIFLVLIIIFLSSCSSLEKKLSQLEISPESNSIESAKAELVTEQNTIADEPAIITDIKTVVIVDHPPAPEKPIKIDNLWDKIPQLYKMPALENPVLSNQRIESEKTWYLNHPEYLYRVSKRAQPYLYLIVEQIEQRQLPAELALLPIVESAFQPHAYSRGRAAGLWQFIPGTGKYFGLKPNLLSCISMYSVKISSDLAIMCTSSNNGINSTCLRQPFSIFNSLCFKLATS